MKLSRHARNNMRLYGITEEDISNAIQAHDSIEISEDKVTVIKSFTGRFSGYPLKVVFKPGVNAFIITAYPLKKAFGGKKT